jgi:hypothetical protein
MFSICFVVFYGPSYNAVDLWILIFRFPHMQSLRLPVVWIKTLHVVCPVQGEKLDYSKASVYK